MMACDVSPVAMFDPDHLFISTPKRTFGGHTFVSVSIKVEYITFEGEFDLVWDGVHLGRRRQRSWRLIVLAA